MSVTFTSHAYENDATTPSERFPPRTLDATDGQSLEQARNRIVSGRPAAMSFRGRNLIQAAAHLEQIEARGLAGPRANQAGWIEAVIREGELVTVSLTLGDGEPLERTGIVTDLSFTIGSGGPHAQSLDLVFHRVDRIRFVGSSLVLSAERPR